MNILVLKKYENAQHPSLKEEQEHFKIVKENSEISFRIINHLITYNIFGTTIPLVNAKN